MDGEVVERLQMCFKQWDSNHDGSVSEEEFITLFKQLNPTLTREELIKLFASVDKNGNGSVDKNEFVEFLFAAVKFREKAIAFLDGAHVDCFICLQQTKLAIEKRKIWMGACAASKKAVVRQDSAIKASLPAFNQIDEVREEKTVVQINAPCYGVIREAISSTLSSPSIRAVADQFDILNIPKRRLDTFIQKKIRNKSLQPLVKAARDRSKSAADKEACDRLEGFENDFANLDASTIENMEQWKKFMKKHVSPGFDRKLHFDHLLSNFGFSDEIARELREVQHETTDKVSGEKDMVSLEHFSFRWLSKAFVAYGIPGCLTDIVNLVFAMTGASPEGMSEDDMVQLIDDCWTTIACGEFDKLWIPSLIALDAECDDCLSWLILESIHQRRGTKLQVLVQLPTNSDMDILATKLGQYEGVTVFRDPDSKNMTAIKKNFPMLFPSK